MSSFFKHIGKQKAKFIFAVEVHKIVLPRAPGITSGDNLTVSFEKGEKKYVLSADHVVSVQSNGDALCEVHETLTMTITLYKDNAGVFQEKIGKINVFQRRRGIAGMKNSKEGLKSLGICSLPLHGLSDGKAYEKTLPLGWSTIENAMVFVTVTARPADENASDADDDAESVASSQPSQISSSQPTQPSRGSTSGGGSTLGAFFRSSSTKNLEGTATSASSSTSTTASSSASSSTSSALSVQNLRSQQSDSLSATSAQLQEQRLNTLLSSSSSSSTTTTAATVAAAPLPTGIAMTITGKPSASVPTSKSIDEFASFSPSSTAKSSLTPPPSPPAKNKPMVSPPISPFSKPSQVSASMSTSIPPQPTADVVLKPAVATKATAAAAVSNSTNHISTSNASTAEVNQLRALVTDLRLQLDYAESSKNRSTTAVAEAQRENATLRTQLDTAVHERDEAQAALDQALADITRERIRMTSLMTSFENFKVSSESKMMALAKYTTALEVKVAEIAMSNGIDSNKRASSNVSVSSSNSNSVNGSPSKAFMPSPFANGVGLASAPLSVPPAPSQPLPLQQQSFLQPQPRSTVGITSSSSAAPSAASKVSPVASATPNRAAAASGGVPAPTPAKTQQPPAKAPAPTKQLSTPVPAQADGSFNPGAAFVNFTHAAFESFDSFTAKSAQAKRP